MKFELGSTVVFVVTAPINGLDGTNGGLDRSCCPPAPTTYELILIVIVISFFLKTGFAETVAQSLRGILPFPLRFTQSQGQDDNLYIGSGFVSVEWKRKGPGLKPRQMHRYIHRPKGRCFYQ